MKWFSKTGEWVEPADDGWTVGLSQENVDDLGDVTFVELPPVGTSVTPEAPAGVIEAVKAATDFHSPISGIVLAVNLLLSSQPTVLNSSPQDQGWLFRLGNVPADALTGLMAEPEWRSWMAIR